MCFTAFLLVFQVIGRERCSGGAQKRPEVGIFITLLALVSIAEVRQWRMEVGRLWLQTHAHCSLSVLITLYTSLSCQHLWYTSFCRPGWKTNILFVMSHTSVGHVFKVLAWLFSACVSVSQHKTHRHQRYRPREISTHGRFPRIPMASFWAYFKVISVYYIFRKSSKLWLHMKLRG